MNKKPHKLHILLKQQEGVCGICKQPLKIEDANFDHILPKSKGGTGRMSNLQATHVHCNNMKGNGDVHMCPKAPKKSAALKPFSGCGCFPC